MPRGTPIQGRKWTINEVAAVNAEKGFFFFSKSTMKGFGDTMASFSVVHADGRVFVKRVKAARNHPVPTLAQGDIGQLREFFPETGNIGVILRPDQLPESLR